MATFGTVMGAAALVGDWSTVTWYDGRIAPAWSVSKLEGFGVMYMVALIVMVALTAGTLFLWADMRALGLVAGISAILLLSCMAKALPNSQVFEISSSGATLPQTLGWGIYAAFAGFAALTAALVLLPKARPQQGRP
ncbi:hypothetical protein Rhe02_65380 [Rhizocola hellebori]|uniref:Uncharacterized protein n=2 Tax=Rhizocola hellebori TaxID=1392758 RepID=A0A8J3VJW1_9ACTN|nr:hypothetical protein Rhe02_65380 [Rhizocola hellebori]